MLKHFAKMILPPLLQDYIRSKPVRIRIIKHTRSSWISKKLKYISPYDSHSSLFDRIDGVAVETQRLGALPLWEGYKAVNGYPTTIGEDATRTSNQVRTHRRIGEFFTWLVLERKPSIIIEFGAAFGVSGMYWLAGLNLNKSGHLYSFEPNATWANVAQGNMQKICDRFTLTVGTFEGNFKSIESQEYGIDIAFIDAIHTSEFVYAQLELILRKAAPGCIIVFDDIDFSKDMQNCWNEICNDSRFASAMEVNNVGIVELPTI